jgi:hypothetical protein
MPDYFIPFVHCEQDVVKLLKILSSVQQILRGGERFCNICELLAILLLNKSPL